MEALQIEVPRAAKKVFKRYVARPDEYGVVTLPHNFVPTEDMNQVTGEWPGVLIEEV